jgi:hypothetical protein
MSISTNDQRVTEQRLRARIAALERTCDRYDHLCQTGRLDALRKRAAALESALSDVVYLTCGDDPAGTLEERGLSRERAREIVALLSKNFAFPY